MVSLTLSIPEKVKKEMEEFPEMNWSEVARTAIIKRVLMLKQFKEFAKDNKITEEDALRWGAEVNRRATQRRLNNEKSKN